MELNVYTLHVLSSNNRRWAFMGSASMQGVPLDRIYFSSSPHLRKYDNNIRLVAKAAAKDGFPYLEGYGKGLKSQYVQQTAGSMGQIWNYCRIFRHIAQTGVPALVIHDDRMITLNWHIFKQVIEYLNNKGEFKLFQLRLRTGQPKTIPEQIQNNDLSEFDKDNPLNHIISGLKGYEESMVITPAGANFILDALASNMGDYYFFDDFIHRKLCELSIGIAGIYCSAKEEYAFVRESLEFSSITDWAHKDSEYYEHSKAQQAIQFLEHNDG